ncbi:unnamed protein product (macronuclear) [Paramecium tetraurelia]|uniref:TLDc domain-containing protein n=1 Tax=Paramecium tetraurelia TaxID=5888 RepID=A0CK73_PARTE|nr:uncharacterized protein GSPATT00000903001 [Paramecium tetraurelia]CAK71190.1 unnamed protein product [Paramecium tetraurelia]|eukprot:XP_001438587.1 hypothetical protein (macronuclear) [Paramecium tetraurelia strain d4-2]
MALALAKNIDLHLPYQQLPTKKQKKIKIHCLEYGHRDQKVEYLNLTPETDVIKSRLQCIKCINGPYSNFRQQNAVLEEVLSDDMNVMKHTHFQGNLYQEFSNLYHSLNLDISKDDIKFRIATIKKQILYDLQVLEQDVLSNYDKYQEIQDKIKQQVDNLKPDFDFSELQVHLENYAKEGPNPPPKSQKKINDLLNKYVQNLHNPKIAQKKIDSLEQLKTKVNDFTKKLCFHIHKLDQGMEKIQNIIEEMKKTFSENNFTQSQLSNDYISIVLERIDKDYKDTTKVEQIKNLYTSIHEGLKYDTILNHLKQEESSKLLFIFKSSNSQIFGAYTSPALAPAPVLAPAPAPALAPAVQNPSFMFSLSKQQIYPLNSNTKPLQYNKDANDINELFTLGTQDLVIQSSFEKCKSKLGSSFDLSGYQITNQDMHLANAVEFEIVALEIFKL